MKETQQTNLSQYYEIIFQGYLDERWQRFFDGLEVTRLPGGRTRVAGDVIDQSALFGMLSRIRDLGLPLLLVRRGDVELDLNDLTVSKNTKE